jgi:hypothetical protein
VEGPRGGLCALEESSSFISFDSFCAPRFLHGRLSPGSVALLCRLLSLEMC